MIVSDGLLAILIGMMVAVSRTLNSYLSAHRGPIQASLINHFLGFLLLTIVIISFCRSDLHYIALPNIYYLGGACGVLFVAVNSYVAPRIGSTNTVLLVITGQMITSITISHFPSNITFASMFGVILIVSGAFLLEV